MPTPIADPCPGMVKREREGKPAMEIRPVSDEFDKDEAMKRCYELLKNDPRKYKIDPCPGRVQREILQIITTTPITGPVRCAVAPCPQPGQPGQPGRMPKPPTIRRGDLIFKKPQSFLNKEYFGVQTKYLLIAGAGLVYVGILLS